MKILKMFACMGCILAWQGQLLGQPDPVDMSNLLDCEFSSVSDHPYYPFAPGDSKTLTGDEDGEDIAENIAMSQMLSTPAGAFEEVIEIWEYTPLEPADEPSIKHYARGIGLLTDNELTLTRFTQTPKLTIARAVKVTWPGAGTDMQLQSATTPQGPWNPVIAEIDRITPLGDREIWVMAGSNNRFFRLAVP